MSPIDWTLDKPNGFLVHLPSRVESLGGNLVKSIVAIIIIVIITIIIIVAVIIIIIITVTIVIIITIIVIVAVIIIIIIITIIIIVAVVSVVIIIISLCPVETDRVCVLCQRVRLWQLGVHGDCVLAKLGT